MFSVLGRRLRPATGGQGRGEGLLFERARKSSRSRAYKGLAVASGERGVEPGVDADPASRVGLALELLHDTLKFVEVLLAPATRGEACTGYLEGRRTSFSCSGEMPPYSWGTRIRWTRRGAAARTRRGETQDAQADERLSHDRPAHTEDAR